MKIEFTLNNKAVKVDLPPEHRLLDVLRDEFGLKSLKEGCGEGECGACAVLLDGNVVASCILPIGKVNGHSVETVEGIRESGSFKTIQEAFKKAGAVQCGFCTPGMVVSTEALLRNNSNPTQEDIRNAVTGNLCRCTGYNMIIEGIRLAVQKREEK
ncbi:MAG: (2Fe-2S)-binding protein [Bacteroidota bacterium]